MFFGFNAGFFPMHIAGLLGMPRRIYTYSSTMGWDSVNMVISLGSFLFAIGILIFLANVVFSLKRGVPAGPNPWDAATLEWTTSSPPPAYNFAVIPTVASRHPLWEDRLGENGGRSSIAEGYLLMQGRETIGTSPIDARPVAILKMPHDSPTPFFVGLFVALLFVGLLLHWWPFSVVMALSGTVALTVWMWPRKRLAQRVAAGSNS